MEGNLKHDMDRLVTAHGYAAPVSLLAFLVGWQAKWYRFDLNTRVERAGKLLAEAATLLQQVEQEEQAGGCRLQDIGQSE